MQRFQRNQPRPKTVTIPWKLYREADGNYPFRIPSMISWNLDAGIYPVIPEKTMNFDSVIVARNTACINPRAHVLFPDKPVVFAYFNWMDWKVFRARERSVPG